MAGRTYKWESAFEWFQENVEYEEFVGYLIREGAITSDHIQDHFESEMDEDGYFDGWPSDKDYPLRQLDGENQCGAACRFCNRDVSDEEIDALDEGIMPEEFECEEDEEDGMFEECPIRLWIDSGKKVDE
jgi:hypothetical protein